MPNGEKPGEPLAPPPIQPLPITLIGVREDDTGAPIVDGQVIVTPANQPNLVANVVPVAVALLIRTAFVYATSFMGFLTMVMVPAGDNPVLKAMHAMEFAQLAYTAAGIAIAPAGYEFGKSVLTILGRLERRFPLLTGSV